MDLASLLQGSAPAPKSYTETYGKRSAPLSPPVEEPKCSLPSISTLLEGADGHAASEYFYNSSRTVQRTNALHRASTPEPSARTQSPIRRAPAPNTTTAPRLRLRPQHITERVPKRPPLLNLLHQLPHGPLRISRTERILLHLPHITRGGTDTPNHHVLPPTNGYHLRPVHRRTCTYAPASPIAIPHLPSHTRLATPPLLPPLQHSPLPTKPRPLYLPHLPQGFLPAVFAAHPLPLPHGREALPLYARGLWKGLLGAQQHEAP